MSIPSQKEYEAREMREAMAKEREVESASLAERKEAQADFLKAMKEPDLIAERIGWLIDGNYGWGPMMRAKQVVKAKRMNRQAALNQLIGIYEWSCPPRMAADAWKKLSKAEQSILERAINIVIEAAEKEEE
jgi:hypothetical protein